MYIVYFKDLPKYVLRGGYKGAIIMEKEGLVLVILRIR